MGGSCEASCSLSLLTWHPGGRASGMGVGVCQGSWACLAEGSRPGLVPEPPSQGFFWKDGGRGSVGNVASLMKGTRVGAVTPGWQYMAWYRVQKRFLQVAVGVLGHLSGTGLGSDSWLCPGGALEKETVAKLWLSPVFFGS